MSGLSGSPGVAAAELLALTWLVAELTVRLRAVSRFGPSNPSGSVFRDRGSFWAILLLAWSGVVAAYYLAAAGRGPFLPPLAWVAGVVVGGAGIALRAWAIDVLGRYFAVVVRIVPDHRIVRTGPYRWLRHPSYTGAFVAILGIVIALGSVLGIIVGVLTALAAFVYRIHVEEDALRARFGEEYVAYARETSRLFPGLY